MTSPQHPMIVALARDGNAIRIELSNGTVYVSQTPEELWTDVAEVLSGGATRRALGAAERNGNAGTREVIDAELVDDAEADEYDHHTDPVGEAPSLFSREGLENVVTSAGDVFTEYCSQEYGELGRMFANGVRRNAKPIHDAISPRAKKKARARARRRR